MLNGEPSFWTGTSGANEKTACADAHPEPQQIKERSRDRSMPDMTVVERVAVAGDEGTER